MFRFTRKPSSGNHNQYLAKITGLVQCRYICRTDVSVMAAYYDLCGVCVVLCVSAITLTTSVRGLYLHWTRLLILAKYWLWLPNDGFFVNRNMLE